MTKLTPSSSRHVVLKALKDGPIERHDALALARGLVGSDAGGVMALHRMVADGLATCEYRLTRKGAKALKAAK